MRRPTTLEWVFLILLIIGGVNWGLVGLFGFDLVEALFGTMTAASRIVYAAVGLAAIYILASSLARTDRPVTDRPIDRRI